MNQESRLLTLQRGLVALNLLLARYANVRLRHSDSLIAAQRKTAVLGLSSSPDARALRTDPLEQNA